VDGLTLSTEDRNVYQQIFDFDFPDRWTSSAGVEVRARSIASAAASSGAIDRPALFSAPFTPNNTPDLCTQSLEKAFYNQATGLLPYLDKGKRIHCNFEVRNGADRTSLNTISKNLCGSVTPDLVFYTGRATYLPTFLENLHQRQCRSIPITVVTGSDAATLDRKMPALNDPDAPISVLYVPSPTQPSSTARTTPTTPRSRHSPMHSAGPITDRSSIRVAGRAAGRSWPTMPSSPRAWPSARPSTHPRPRPYNAVGAQLYLFDTSNVIEGAGGFFRIDTRTGNRLSTHDPQVVQLGTTGGSNCRPHHTSPPASVRVSDPVALGLEAPLFSGGVWRHM
jgi:hypothetical protein